MHVFKTTLKLTAAACAFALATACETTPAPQSIENTDRTPSLTTAPFSETETPTTPASIRPREVNLSRFDDAIAAFKTADTKNPPAECSVLFVGSSSIRFWNTLAEDFPNRDVINRGFGGSTIAEVSHYFDQIVAPYKPSAIVFYAGENDLTAGQQPSKVVADFNTFMKQKRDALGETPVWFVSAKPSILRFDQMDLQAQVNAAVSEQAKTTSDLAYIDVVAPMLKPDGKPKDIFVADDLHMTPAGYDIWTPIVENALKNGQNVSAPHC